MDRRFLTCFLWVVLACSPVGAQKQVAPGIFLDAEFRPRIELDRRQFYPPAGFDAYATFRTRVGIELRDLIEHTTFYLRIADSRLMGFSDPYLTGEPIGPNKWDNNLGVSMAYLEIRRLFLPDLFLRIGRMENNQGRNRIFGPGNWNVYGPRTYDGFKIGLEKPAWQAHLWSFWGLAGDRHWYFNPDTPGKAPDARFAYKADHLLIGHDLSLVQKQVNLLLFLDLDQQPVTVQTTGKIRHRFHRLTAAANLKGITFAQGSFRLDGDLAYQWGEQTDPAGISSIRAYLLTADLRYQFQDRFASFVTLGFDITSGDQRADDHKMTQFYEYYYSRHSYQGHMDYFKSPDGVKRYGLQDFILRSGFTPLKNWQVRADLHRFRTQFRYSPESASRWLGTELDITIDWQQRSGLIWRLGLDTFWPHPDWQGNLAETALYVYWSVQARL